MQGRIIRGIAGFYYVVTQDDEIWECRARGVFRKRGQKPLVGDVVDIAITDPEAHTANVERICARKNSLIRPEVANVDQALIFFALKSPDPDASLLDKFLVMTEKTELPAVICFNKTDLVSEESIRYWTEMYSRCGADICTLSAKTGEGTDRLREVLTGKTTVIAGPSGAGKSTLTNLLQDRIHMETGDISKKLGRGRNTTRHAELMPIGEQTYFCDTPGFTSLDLPEMEPEELGNYFTEFAEYVSQCRFRGCSHTHEPDCAVRRAVEDGRISRERYAHYCAFYEELVERKKHRYQG